MFWNVFYELCLAHKTRPNPVAKELGISSASVTKWKNGSMPSVGTAQRIADYFGVSVDHLLGNNNSPQTDAHVVLVGLTQQERELIFAYRRQPEMHSAIDRLLCIDKQNEVCIYTAAKSEDACPDTVTHMNKKDWERLQNAPQTDDSLM